MRLLCLRGATQLSATLILQLSPSVLFAKLRLCVSFEATKSLFQFLVWSQPPLCAPSVGTLSAGRRPLDGLFSQVHNQMRLHMWKQFILKFYGNDSYHLGNFFEPYFLFVERE